MYTYKKIVINTCRILLIMLLIFANMINAVSFASSTLEKDEEGFELLRQIGLLEENVTADYFEQNITRGEFANLVTSLMNMSQYEGSLSNEPMFSDVSESHKYFNAIYLVGKSGMMSGYPDGTFAPDEFVTYNQAVKVMVCLLGYGFMAENKGGFPTGYLNIATQLDLFLDYSKSYDSVATRYDVYKLIYKCLDADVLQQTVYGKNEEYEKISGETLLFSRYGIRKREGIITASNYSAYNSIRTNLPDEGWIEIDGVVYRTNGINANDLLGYSVVYYVNETNGENDLIYIRLNEKKNEIIKIEASRLKGFNASDFTFSYETEENKKKKTRVSQNSDVIYNGVYYKKVGDIIDETILLPEAGNLTLLDRNNDGMTDTVFVLQYDNVVVDGIIPHKYEVSFKDGYLSKEKSYVTLDPDSKEYDVTVTRDGKPYFMENIREWDVLSIAQSINTTGKKHISVIVSKQTMVAKIDATQDEFVYLNGTKYRVSPVLNNAAWASELLSLGTEGIFYLDFMGDIVGVQRKSTPKDGYAYVLDEEYLREGLKYKMYFKLLLSDGTIEWIETGEKVYLNNSRNALTPKEISQSIEIDDKNQLIRFEINSDDKIKKIETFADMSDVTDYKGYTQDEFTLDFKSERIRTMNGSISGRYILNEETVAFFIPPDITDLKEAEDYELYAGGYGQIPEWCSLEVYDATDRRYASVVLVKDYPVQEFAGLAVVDKIRYVINEDRDENIKLEVFQGGRKVAYESERIDLNQTAQSIFQGKTYKNNLLENVEKGDILRLGINKDGKIANFQLIVPVEEALKNPDAFVEYKDFNTVITGDDIQSNNYTAYVRVVEKSANTFTVTTGSNGYRGFAFGATDVYIYDSQENTVSMGTKNDVSVNDNVFIRVDRTAYVREIFIIR